MPRTGVALLQMGGPRSPAEVQPFLERLFADPDIIRLPRAMRPFQPRLARTIARRRAPSVVEKYASIARPGSAACVETLVRRNAAGGSPLCATTDRLADAVARALADLGADVPVVAAYRYVEPDARGAIRRLRDAGATDVLAVPLYPHWSVTTTGSSWNDFERASRAERVPARLLPRWGLHPGYLDLAASDAQAALDRVPEANRGRVHLLFSAHGIPQRYADAGDPYPTEIRRTAEALAARLEGHDSWNLAFQSEVGPVRWIEPQTGPSIRAGGAWSALVVVPLGFVSDHIETLWDADTLFAADASAAGIPFYARAAMLNDRPEFASFLAGLVLEQGGILRSRS